MIYFRVHISTRAILAGPIPLPDHYVGLTQDSLDDLDTAMPGQTMEPGIGYWPLGATTAAPCDAYQVLAPVTYAADPTSQTVTGAQAAVDVSLAQAQGIALNAVFTSASAGAGKGFGIPVNGTTYTFATDPQSRSDMQGEATAAGLAGTNPFSCTWVFSDGSSVIMDGPTTIATGQALRNKVQPWWNQAGALGARIKAATTVAALRAIDLTAGWPTA